MNLVLSLTERCNLRCTYCYYKVSHEARSLVMSNEIMEAAIRLAFERTLLLGQRFLNITFFGGEPLLCMESIHRGVEFAKEIVRERFGDGFEVGVPTSAPNSSKFRLRFAVNTNGTLLDDSIIEYLKQGRFRIYLSLDGPEAHHDICRKQVGGAGSFKLIEPHIPALRKLDTVVLSVVTRENMRSLSDAVRWIQAQGLRNMTAAVDFDGKWTGEEFDVLAAEYVKMAGFWMELKRKKVPFYLGLSPVLRMVTFSPVRGLSPAKKMLPISWATFTTIRRKFLAGPSPETSAISLTATRKTVRAVPSVSAAMPTNVPAPRFIPRAISTRFPPRYAHTNVCSPRYATMPCQNLQMFQEIINFHPIQSDSILWLERRDVIIIVFFIFCLCHKTLLFHIHNRNIDSLVCLGA